MTQPPSDPGTPGDATNHPEGEAAPPSYPGPPPANPYGAPPAAPYGQPTPYGHPAGPPFGQPPAPYGHPYGQPFPGGSAQPRPSQAMAATALVLAFLSCTGVLGIAAIVLGVIVLRRSRRDGRNHGTGMAIAAIVVSVVGMLATAALVALIAVGVNSLDDVNDLSRGDCFDARGLTAEDADEFTSLDIVPCDERHDAEVIDTVTLSSAEAERYRDDSSYGGRLCMEATDGWVPDPTADLQAIHITDRTDPDAGDKVACVVAATGGEKLTEPVG
ncbi:DUF4190 domain-containing protein [Nocardioides pantholopis]|uniref:DUF4190 domain-containing protein n=1 Tax=Nocardioides pantholopis TaxID=2483798 RepID=UPI000F07447E|nr:DUF4190 domain-containing protein [Nocardioides pantholopis]